jgi:hypothetical protein
MAELLLHSPNIHASFQQMGGKGAQGASERP